MSEPSSGSSGCLTLFLILVAAIFAPFMAAFNASSSPLVAPSEIVTTVVLAPIGTFSTDDLNQAAVVIKKRLNSLLITGATVETAGDSLRLGLPQVENLDVVLRVVTARGLLEFVDFSGITELPAWTGQDILTTGQGNHPISENSANNPVTNKPFETVMTNADVQSAAAQYDNIQWVVRMEFSDEGAKTIQAFTHSHIGKPLAIVIDGKVLRIPIIEAELSAGATIQSNFTEEEAQELAVQIGGGALPFQLAVRSMQSDVGIPVSTVAPTTTP